MTKRVLLTAIVAVLATVATAGRVSVRVAPECFGLGSVTAVDKYFDGGAKVPLKATAEKGFAFAGWYDGDGKPLATTDDYRTASTTCLAREEDEVVYARFVAPMEDDFWIDNIPDGITVDLNIEMSEYPESSIGGLVFSRSQPAITAQGLPPGVKFDAKRLVLYGQASKPGVYYAAFTGKNASGFKHSRVLKFLVGGAKEPEEPNELGIDPLDLEWFDEKMYTGYGYHRNDFYIDSQNAAGAAVTKVVAAGLPAGWKAAYNASEKAIDLEGPEPKPGRYTMTLTATYADKTTAKTVHSFTVLDSGSRYVDVRLGYGTPDVGGTVSGSGVYAYGEALKISAKAAKDYVFTGWRDEDGDGLDLYDAKDDPIDYRTPSPGKALLQEWTFDVDQPAGSVFTVFADFEPSGADVFEFDGAATLTFELDWGERYIYFRSDSLPSIAFKGLPAGLAYYVNHSYATIYVDDLSKLKPGVYTVTATGTNASKQKDSAEYIVVIRNFKDDEIMVADEYGPYLVGTYCSLSLPAAQGCTVSGLPAGLKWDAKNFIISGTPTKSGTYTVTFTKKTGSVVHTATSTMEVEPVVNLAVAAFGHVTGIDGPDAKGNLNLKAVSDGYVFAGWSWEGVSGLAALEPSLTIPYSGSGRVNVGATFVPVYNDYLWIDEIPDVELGVGEDIAKTRFGGDFPESYLQTRSYPTISFTGLPAGLKWDAKSLRLTGKATKAGVYYATVSAKNVSGYKHSRIVTFRVGGATVPEEKNEAGLDPEDFVFFDWMMHTAYGYHSLYFTLPDKNGSAPVKAAIKGLPSGWKATVEKMTYDNGVEVFRMLVEEVSPKPGRYTMEVTVTYADKSTAKTEHSFVMRDSGSRYVEVALDEKRGGACGTVSGSGVYAYGEPLKISAKAANGYVFSGWYEIVDEYYDDEVEEWVRDFDPVEMKDAKGDYVDHRTPSPSKGLFSSHVWGDYKEQGSYVTIYASFVAAAADSIRLDDMDGETIYPDYDSNSGYFDFTVVSASLPGSVSIKGIPAGIKSGTILDTVEFWVDDPSKLKPGVYPVSVSVSNASKNSAAATFNVFVPNLKCAAFDFYGEPDAYETVIGQEITIDAALMDGYEDYAVTVSGLPAGMSYSHADGIIFGPPAKPGYHTVTLTAKKGSDVQIATVTVHALGLPDWAVGTFNGGFYRYLKTSGYDPEEHWGSATVTISSAGKVSAKVTFDNGVTWTYPLATFTRFSYNLSLVGYHLEGAGDAPNAYIAIGPEPAGVHDPWTDTYASTVGHLCWADEGASKSDWSAGDLLQTVWAQPEHKNDLKDFGLVRKYANVSLDDRYYDGVLEIKPSGAMTFAGTVVGKDGYSVKKITMSGTLSAASYEPSMGYGIGLGYMLSTDKNGIFGYGAYVRVVGTPDGRADVTLEPDYTIERWSDIFGELEE